MKRLLVLLSILLCTFVFVACSDSGTVAPPSDPAPSDPAPDDETVNEETAQDLVDFALKDSEFNAVILKSGGDPSALVGYLLAAGFGGLGNLQIQQADDCVTETTSGDTTTTVFDCTEVTPQASYSFKGKMISTENETSARIYTDPKIEFSVTSSGQSYSFDYDFDISVVTTATGLTMNADFDLTTVENGVSLGYKYSAELSYLATATGGTVTYSGSSTFNKDGRTYTFTTATTPNLVYSNTCTQSPVGGGIRYMSGSDTVQITFTGCGTYTATLNGNPLSP